MNVLAIGAHPDDIELGCGGALLRHVAVGDRVTMLVMTSGERGPQLETSRVREQEAAAAVIGAELIWGGFPDCGITQDHETIALIDRAIDEVEADLVYTHSPDDTHQDHVVTSSCSLSAARRVSRILCYQAPTTTRFEPTVFVNVEDSLEAKLEALRCHQSQVIQCRLVDLEAVGATSRYWGSQARLRHAEAFQAPRFVWDIAAPAATGRRHLSSVDTGIVAEAAVSR